MANTALQRLTQAILTNKSGGSVAQGDVVIIDTSTASSFTTTTTSGFVNGVIGVVLEPNGIANDASGMVAFAGPVPKINLSGSASLADLFKTHSVAKQAVRHAAGIQAGDFGIVLGTGTSPAALLWGLPAGATGAGSGDFTGPGSSVAGNLVGFNDTSGKVGKDSGLSLGGWVSDANTWTYSSADGPTFVISVNADMTGVLAVGMRIKLTQTTAKYFGINAVGAYSGGATLITVTGGTDYTLANAAITSPYYSTAKAPLGFPMDPTKWTISISDTTTITQNTPTTNTWYNLGGLVISIPIGGWNAGYQTALQVAGNQMQQTLSTANNSESDADFTSAAYSTAAIIHTFTRFKTLVLAAKTSYYLNARTGGSGSSFIQTRGDISKTIVSATWAYL